MENLQRVYDFMRDAGYYFLLTVDENGYPKGRAFTSKAIMDGKLYLATEGKKRVFQQIQKNPHVEIMAYQLKNQCYMRVDATAVINEDSNLVKQYLAQAPQDRDRVQGDAEKQMRVFYLSDAKAEILALDGTVKETFSF